MQPLQRVWNSNETTKGRPSRNRANPGLKGFNPVGIGKSTAADATMNAIMRRSQTAATKADSVGETPTEATGTVALAQRRKKWRFCTFFENKPLTDFRKTM